MPLSGKTALDPHSLLGPLQQRAKVWFLRCGAGGGTRTLTLLPELDFESSASTNSAIPAWCSPRAERCPRAMETALSRKTAIVFKRQPRPHARATRLQALRFRLRA